MRASRRTALIFAASISLALTQVEIERPGLESLRSGWATYVASLIVDSRDSPGFWRSLADRYFREDEGNASTRYIITAAKSAWLFRMLADASGSDGFRKIVKNCSFEKLGDWPAVAGCAQTYSPPEVDLQVFLLPWMTSRRVPQLAATADVRTVTIHQEAPYFTLPVVVEAATAQGPERHRIWIAGAETTVNFFSLATGPKIDPDHLLLLNRTAAP